MSDAFKPNSRTQRTQRFRRGRKTKTKLPFFCVLCEFLRPMRPAVRLSYSGCPMVNAISPTPSIFPVMTSPGSTAPTPSGVPV